MHLFKKNYLFVLLLVVVFIAVFFRFWKIDVIPFGLNNDAAWEGSAAIEILRGNFSSYIPYAVEGWRGEGIIRLIIAFLMIFLGNNPITIPLSTALFGVGLVIGVFFLLKHLFNWQLAILTSFFISISGWHITFSKSGWRAVTVPFFTTLLFYFYFRGIESKNKIHFILSGAMLSIVSLYTYDGARVVPVFFVFWVLLEAITRRSFLKIYGKSLVYLFLSCLIVSLPMIVYAYSNWQNFISRSDFLFVGHEIQKIGDFSPLINNILHSLLLFNVSGNGNDFFIFDPLVDKPVSWLLPIGFIITCFIAIFRRSKIHFFILCWFLISLIPGILSVPNGNRAIGTIPTVYFFAAASIYYPLKFISNLFAKNKIIVFSGVLISLFCFYTMYLTYRDYLGPNRRELTGFYPETLVATNYIKTIWDDYDIYLTDNYPRELLTFYLFRDNSPNAFYQNYTWLESNTMFLTVNKNPDKGLAFFMFDNPENRLILENLLDKWTKAEVQTLFYENDNIAKRPASLVVLVK